MAISCPHKDEDPQNGQKESQQVTAHLLPAQLNE